MCSADNQAKVGNCVHSSKTFLINFFWIMLQVRQHTKPHDNNTDCKYRIFFFDAKPLLYGLTATTITAAVIPKFTHVLFR